MYVKIGVYFTQCILDSVYTVLGGNSRSWHGELMSDNYTLGSMMI